MCLLSRIKLAVAPGLFLRTGLWRSMLLSGCQGCLAKPATECVPEQSIQFRAFNSKLDTFYICFHAGLSLTKHLPCGQCIRPDAPF